MKPPIIYKLDIFIITQSFVDRCFVIFSKIPMADTISLLIDDFTSVLQSDYEIVKITESNKSQYNNIAIGSYVLSWKNSTPEIKQIFQNKIGKKLVLQYVNYEEPEAEQEKNQEDHINWQRI